MKRLRKTVLRIVPAEMLFPLLLAPFWNLLAYYGARVISAGFPRFRMVLPLDAEVPFLPWTVSIYVLSYLFWAVNFTLAARCGERCAFRVFCADFLSKCVSFACFLLLPCTLDRPELSGGGFWTFVLGIIYSADTPINLFPSIHCITSYFSAFGILREKTVPLWYRVFSLFMMLAVFVSTLTTRQHVLADVIGAVFFSVVLFRLSGIDAVRQTYRRFTKLLLRPFRHE